ncbi:S26 family signal peptidase [Sandaracinobacteroides saxicola]|uniref:S26 family signal peptidase n=1 Tax=Sandaracinobacteroides saxicola TaxID=2759707 RepID=A0A7G5IGI2_9SPHN|nr:S26 family signal peptidase [Sandaracinobacteroides saxicola]QMW22474.1 S26 family signal peptidase [Sandaracinobacteroides saxicola]
MVIISLIAAMPKKVFWNASASVPIGLYLATSPAKPGIGDIVVFDPPAEVARFADSRGYLPLGTPMLKRVAGLAGDRICRRETEVRVANVVLTARDRDRKGRPLPVWEGCRTLGRGEVFLLNVGVPDSLDGRYFGPQPIERVAAIAVPIWTFGSVR